MKIIKQRAVVRHIIPSYLFVFLNVLYNIAGKTLSESYKDAHMTLHTGDSVTCTVCNRKFDSADSLAMHAAVHVELIPPQSPTPQISISTSSIVEATTTSTTTSATMPPTSTITVTSTTTVTTATTTTVMTAEPADSQKPYQCQHCGRRFTRPHEKVKHERIHTGEKPHACEVGRQLCSQVLHDFLICL